MDLSSTIDSLYGVVDGTSSWTDAAATIAETVGARRFGIVTLRPDGSLRHDSWPVAPEGAIEYGRDYAHRDLRVARASKLPAGLYTTRDVMTPEEIARCPVHQEFYRKWPECWNTAMRLCFHDDYIITCMIQRGAVMDEFHQSELAVFEALTPHIVQAVRLSEAFNRLKVRGDELIAAIDSLDDGVVVLDRTGAVEHMSGGARELAAAADGLFVQRGFIMAAHRDERALLERLIARSLKVAAGAAVDLPSGIILTRTTSPHPLIVSPFVVRDSMRARLQVVLKIRDSARTVDPSLEVIRRGLGLTLAEAKIARALTEGLDLETYASEAGLSAATARTHLRNLREKIGARRQGDVIRAVARLRP